MIMILSSYAPAFAVDSYSEYFSEEREFVVNDDTYNYSTYFYSDDETGYLYSRNVDTKEIKLVLAQKVATHYFWNEHLYCVVDGKDIIKITVTGQNPETILTADNDIEQLYVNDDIIFYLSGNAIYRHHRASERTDLIVSDESIYFFYPYTNFIVEYGDGSENQEIKRINKRLRSNTTIVEKYSFVNNLENQSYTRSSTQYNTIYIHGKTVPYSIYSNGTYYNTTGQPCSCHTSSTVCPNGYDCTICMVVQGNNGSATQCHAFGCTVYKYLWGSFGSKNDYSSNPIKINSESKAREVFWGLPSGTMIRAYYKGSSISNHTFIVTNVTSTGATIYEANNPGYCIVSHKTFSFSEIANQYDKIAYTYNGNHSFGTAYGYDENIHWNKCNTSNCNGKSNIERHTFTTTGSVRKCTVCKYNPNNSANSLGDETINE